MFRVLSNVEDAGKWRKGVKAYERHLLRVRKRVPRDLWRYFSMQLFHDGMMSRVSADLCARTLEIDIDCPNVQHRTPKGWEYTTLEFTCRFCGVDYLRTNYDSKWVQGRQFLYAEIDTVSAKEARIETRRPLHSLVIKLHDGWMEFTFTKCLVQPRDRRRFRHMLQNRRDFYIPFPARMPAWARFENMRALRTV